MGRRGPGSNKTLSIIAPSIKRRPNPQPGMSKAARTIWLRIVGAYPPDHFKPQHRGMLRAYCEAEEMHNRSMRGVAKTGDLIKQTNGVIKENPYINIGIKAANIMSQLGTKLGITVNATTATRGESGSVTAPESKRAVLLYGGRK